MVTEDIDISWRLQIAHWDIRYEPNALCWILMPETLRGLWNAAPALGQGRRRGCTAATAPICSTGAAAACGACWPSTCLSVAWAYVMLFIMVLWLLGMFVALPEDLTVHTLLPRWHGMVLGIVCLLQFAISLMIDRRYEPRIGRNYYWMIWYPVAYWMLALFTTVVALPTTLLRRRNRRAVWTSPDRGLR